jgi:hypothetical protein
MQCRGGTGERFGRNGISARVAARYGVLFPLFRPVPGVSHRGTCTPPLLLLLSPFLKKRGNRRNNSQERCTPRVSTSSPLGNMWGNQGGTQPGVHHLMPPVLAWASIARLRKTLVRVAPSAEAWPRRFLPAGGLLWPFFHGPLLSHQ